MSAHGALALVGHARTVISDKSFVSALSTGRLWLGLWDACPERWRVKTHRCLGVGVAQAPKEETAKSSGAAWGGLLRYGDLTVCRCFGHRDASSGVSDVGGRGEFIDGSAGQVATKDVLSIGRSSSWAKRARRGAALCRAKDGIGGCGARAIMRCSVAEAAPGSTPHGRGPVR